MGKNDGSSGIIVHHTSPRLPLQEDVMRVERRYEDELRTHKEEVAALKLKAKTDKLAYVDKMVSDVRLFVTSTIICMLAFLYSVARYILFHMSRL